MTERGSCPGDRVTKEMNKMYLHTGPRKKLALSKNETFSMLCYHFGFDQPPPAIRPDRRSGSGGTCPQSAVAEPHGPRPPLPV